MITYTQNLKLAKPDRSEAATPDPFNANMDAIDAQIANLNSYIPTIGDVNEESYDLKSRVSTLETTVSEHASSINDLISAIGSIGSILDLINGEEV